MSPTVMAHLQNKVTNRTNCKGHLKSIMHNIQEQLKHNKRKQVQIKYAMFIFSLLYI